MSTFNYCSVRIQKLKSSDIKLANGHNLRLVDEKINNINKTKSVDNEILFGSKSIINDYADRLNSFSDEAKPKILNSGKNATTVAVEMIISATPTFFRENSIDWGVYDKKKVDLWKEKVIETLKDKYKENFIHADLHLDEATPHIHAIITPVEQTLRKKRRTKQQIASNEQAKTIKMNVFNAKHMFNREALIQLQTDIAKPLKSLGIERGIKGSKVKHKHAKEYYKDIARFTSLNKEIKVENYKLNNKPIFQSFDEYQEKEQLHVNNYIQTMFENVRKLYKSMQKKADYYKRAFEKEQLKNRNITRLTKDRSFEDVLNDLKTKTSQIDQLKFDNDIIKRQLADKQTEINQYKIKLIDLKRSQTLSNEFNYNS